MRSYLFALACLFLSACSGLPSNVREIPVEKVSITEASQNPDRYKGTSVRWGGLIIEVDTQENYTLVQVLSYPINYYGRPELTKPSDGRFVVKTSEFLDPAIYEKDREVTVVGVLDGDIVRSVGHKTIQVPLLSTKAHYLWPVYQYQSGYGYYGGYGGPYAGPYGYYGPAPYYWGGSYWPYGY
jgi:outer membrane lipoprotein